MNVGIDAISVATAHYRLPLPALAEATGVDPNKYTIGLGQQHFSVPAPDEDTVTMAADAVAQLIGRTGTDEVRSIFFATESSVDQSKAAGVFLHGLLGLPEHVRTVEFKEACYGGTAALQCALALVARNPEERVIVVASDVARYAIDSPGEPTQGAGAVAMMVSASPRIMAIEQKTGVYTKDVNDFWRPNDSSTPFVLGHLSMDAYLDAFTGAWDDFAARNPGVKSTDFARFVHHQPFQKMARKAHRQLMSYTGDGRGDEIIEAGLHYSAQVGNCYTAALYWGIVSLLTHDSGLAGERIGLFSYGSGAVSEFFVGRPAARYAEHVDGAAIDATLASREKIDFSTYRALHEERHVDSRDYATPHVAGAPYRFAGVKDHARRYERNKRVA